MSVIRQLEGLYFMYTLVHFNLFNSVSSLTVFFFSYKENRFRILEQITVILCLRLTPLRNHTPPYTPVTFLPLPHLLPSSALKPQAKWELLTGASKPLVKNNSHPGFPWGRGGGRGTKDADENVAAAEGREQTLPVQSHLRSSHVFYRPSWSSAFAVLYFTHVDLLWAKRERERTGSFSLMQAETWTAPVTREAALGQEDEQGTRGWHSEDNFKLHRPLAEEPLSSGTR